MTGRFDGKVGIVTGSAGDITAGGGTATAVPVAATVDAFGGIDHLVNNAATYGGMRLDLLLTVDWDYYRRFMSVNMDGALLCTRACWTAMAERGDAAWITGQICNVDGGQVVRS